MKFPQKIPIYIFSRGGLGCMIFFCIKFDPFQALLNLYGPFGNMYITSQTEGVKPFYGIRPFLTDSLWL